MCEGLRPGLMPGILKRQFDLLPVMNNGEAHEDYQARLSPDQRAVYAAFHKEAADGTRYMRLCN